MRRRSWIWSIALAGCAHPGAHADRRVPVRIELVGAEPGGASVEPRSGARCDVGSCDYRHETCCESEDGRRMTGCVPKTPAPSSQPYHCNGPRARDWIGIECLTSDDCPNAQRCCVQLGDDYDLNYCADRCETAVACVPGDGARCRPGFRCAAMPELRSGGLCVVEARAASCGALSCAEPTPACCYDDARKLARCIDIVPGVHSAGDPICPWNEHTTLIQCGSSADCGGEHCCLNETAHLTSCAGACTGGRWVCATVLDCPRFLGTPRACSPDPVVLVLKTCRYGD